MVSLRLPRRGSRDPEGRMPVLDHMRELRNRLIKMIIIIAVGAILGWFLYDPILAILKHPYCRVPASHRLGAGSNGDECNLYFTDPLGGFTTRLKVSIMAGAIMTAPLWLYQLWAFITPGLRKNERRWSITFVFLSTVLFAAGVALAYFTLQTGLDVLITSAGSGTQAALTVTSYLSFVTLMLVIFGASFELPLLIVLLNATGILSYRMLRRSQRLSIFLIFVFAGIATPSTDPFTMIAMAAPMCLLFEGAVLFAFIHDKRKARRQAEAARQAAVEDDQYSTIDPLP